MQSLSLPHVSVVMTVYNGARYLQQSIDSVLLQTFRDFEFIIVDDASTYDTPMILAEAATMDQRIKIVTNQENRDPYPSANIGLHRAPVIAMR